MTNWERIAGTPRKLARLNITRQRIEPYAIVVQVCQFGVGSWPEEEYRFLTHDEYVEWLNKECDN